MMPLQRARGAESRVRNKLSNGPLRAQSNGFFTDPEYSATSGDVTCRGYFQYPDKRTDRSVNSRWYRG